MQLYTFLRSPPSYFHHGDYISAQKNVSLPSVPLSHPSGDLLCGYDLVLQLGEFLALTIAENNKLFSVIAVNLNASLFDSQLNCHSDKWPINANTRVSVVTSMRTSMRAPQIPARVSA